MEPLRGLAGQVWALRRSLRLLLGLLVPCLLLLLLLSALLLLRWRLCRRVGAGRGPSTPPRFLPGTPRAAVLSHDPGGGMARRQLAQTGPRAPCCGRRPAASYLPACSPRPLRPERGAPPTAGSSSSNDLEKPPVLVPPNSLVTSSGTGGVLEKVFSSCHTSTQRKPRTCSRVALGTHSSTGPFEFGSSIRPGDRRAHLNSANFTASQGPGLDSDFGASAGVSVRILSTDSEGSPNTPVVHRQQAGHFEWDYYDPSYKRKAQLHRSVPPICSKQYWL
ncbi:protein huluwa-like [Ahaetulla prasina]|uniref:protein huluwa-like n=1 Tax=Ahaetulla prasina TaxID=499056 RepID=UPI00264864CF|nr:protein huluwa-like [Ahaetulla prasina]